MTKEEVITMVNDDKFMPFTSKVKLIEAIRRIQVDDTLTAAHEQIEANKFTGGMDCPCCGRKVRAYNTVLTGPMTWRMSEIYGHCGMDRWFTIPDIKDELDIVKDPGLSRLRHWGLWDSRPYKGMQLEYKLSILGLSFLRGQAPVPKKLKMYANKITHVFVDELVYVQDLAGKHFSMEDVYEVAPDLKGWIEVKQCV